MATHPAKPALGRPLLARVDPLVTSPHRLAVRRVVEAEAVVDHLLRPPLLSMRTIPTIQASTRHI